MKTEQRDTILLCGQYNSIHDNDERKVRWKVESKRTKRENRGGQSRKENCRKNVRTRNMGTVYSA